MTPSGLYVHIPFCTRRCGYCAFHSWASATEEAQRTFVDRIIEAARILRSGPHSQFATLYVGGGTPSTLPGPLLTELSRALCGLPGQGAERTIEANPETCTDEFLDLVASAGFTRLSLGVQSLDSAALKTLGRVGTSVDRLRRIRRRWTGTLAADLIFGVPDQHSPGASVRAIIDLGVDAVSLYELSVEPGTALAERIAAGSLSVPSEDRTEAQYADTRDLLQSAGFERYEVSSFARPGAACRHNQGYWHMRPYIGLGPSAVSTIHTPTGARRLTWPAAMDAGWDDVHTEEIAPDELAREMVMLALRTSEGLCVEEFAAVFGANLASIAPRALAAQYELGTVDFVAGRIRATDRGLRVLNAVLRDFFREMAAFPFDRPPAWTELRFS